MRFYTYVGVLGNKVLVRGVNAETGNDFIRREEFKPTLFVEGKKGESKHRTLDDKTVYKISPGNIKESRDFIKQYNGVDGFNIHGNDNWALQYTCKEWKDKVDFDSSKIRIWNFDIEVESDKGFPSQERADSVINAITVYDSIEDQYLTWGLGEWINSRDDITVIYNQCDTEEELLQSFLEVWENSPPHILTGWNIETFDIPYVVNRLTRLFGQKEAKRLSPFKWIRERQVKQLYGKEQVAYDLFGVATMDYLQLYRKFTYANQESYRLDHIAFVELGERKISYEEEGSLLTLSRTNHQKFIDYNVKDVELVQRIDDKMKLIELGLTMAYDAKINFQDVFGTVKMWDAIIYDHLRRKNIVTPLKTNSSKSEKYEGAYVKPPITGFHDWVVSFDLNSLYPHLIMQYNISPETIVGHKSDVSVDTLLDKELDLSELKEKDFALAPNGTLYRRDKRGFLPVLMEKIYNDRVTYKKKLLEAQQLKENGEPDMDNDISKYNNIQMAKKIQLNSAYGAVGNQYFRYFDLRNAEAITTGGQLAIRWIEKSLNKFLNKYLETDDYDYVIAIDTDSVYLRLGKFVDKFVKADDKNKICDVIDKATQDAFEPYITKSYEELADYVNAYEQKMFMGREVIADKAVWTAKKRYALNVYDSEGVRYAKPKMKVMGMEIVKSSTPANVRGKLKEAVNLMLTGTESELQALVHKYKKEFKTLPIPDISFPRGLTDYGKYEHQTKSVPIHARAAKVFNHLLKKHNVKSEKIGDGSKLKFVYLKEPNPFNSNAIAFISGIPPEFDVERWVDYDIQFEKAFLSPLEGVLQPVGWDWEEKSSLESFFG